jgi:hypothetical protein
MNKNPWPSQRGFAAQHAPRARSGADVSLEMLQSWAGRALPMHSVASPDPREMTIEELEALGCRRPGVSRAIRQHDREGGGGLEREPPEGAESDLGMALPERVATTRVTMIERLGPQVALGTDGVQWIVYQRKSGQSIQAISWQGATWRAVGYIHSSKMALINCLKVKGLELSSEGQAAIDRQFSGIYRWVTPN